MKKLIGENKVHVGSNIKGRPVKGSKTTQTFLPKTSYDVKKKGNKYILTASDGFQYEVEPTEYKKLNEGLHLFSFTGDENRDWKRAHQWTHLKKVRGEKEAQKTADELRKKPWHSKDSGYALVKDEGGKYKFVKFLDENKINEYDEWKHTRIQAKNIFRMLKQKYKNNISAMKKDLENILKQNKTKDDQAEIIWQEFNKYFKLKENKMKISRQKNKLGENKSLKEFIDVDGAEKEIKKFMSDLGKYIKSYYPEWKVVSRYQTPVVGKLNQMDREYEKNYIYIEFPKLKDNIYIYIYPYADTKYNKVFGIYKAVGSGWKQFIGLFRKYSKYPFMGTFDSGGEQMDFSDIKKALEVVNRWYQIQKNKLGENIMLKENKKASAISQKIITSDKYEWELEKYEEEVPKKLLDKIAKHELSSGEFQYYKNNFNKVKPYLEDDLGSDITENKINKLGENKMKISRNELKSLVREVIKEETEYQEFFKKKAEEHGINLDKLDEVPEAKKKAFFADVEAEWTGEKNEVLEPVSPAQGNPLKSVKAKKASRILAKEQKEEKLIRKLVREELKFVMFADKGNTVGSHKTKKRQITKDVSV